MKKKQKLLVALMALTLAGGVGSALAAVSVHSANTTLNGNFDTMAELTWGETSHTNYSLGNITDLAIGVPQYKYFQVLPKTSASLAGTLTVSFELEVGDGENDVLTGLSIGIYNNSSTAITSANKATFVTSAYEVDVLNESNLTEDATFSVTSGNTTAKQYFALEVLYSGGVASGKSLSATLTIGLNFTPAA